MKGKVNLFSSTKNEIKIIKEREVVITIARENYAHIYVHNGQHQLIKKHINAIINNSNSRNITKKNINNIYVNVIWIIDEQSI